MCLVAQWCTEMDTCPNDDGLDLVKAVVTSLYDVSTGEEYMAFMLTGREENGVTSVD